MLLIPKKYSKLDSTRKWEKLKLKSDITLTQKRNRLTFIGIMLQKVKLKRFLRIQERIDLGEKDQEWL